MGYSIFDETMVDMTWPEIEEAVGKDAIVLLPIGIIEEHGPHMGLAVDTYAAYLVTIMVKHELETRGVTPLIAPPAYWGVSPSTGVFPGTFSMRSETMKAIIYDILASLHSWGFRRVFVINWHGDIGHCLAILEALKDARRDMSIDAVCLLGDSDINRLHLTGAEEYILIHKAPPLQEKTGKYIDIHAGSLETGVMLKYFPEHVRTALAKKLPPTKLTFDDLAKGLGKSHAATRKLIPDGYFGNPAGYDIDVAEKYIKTYTKVVANCIEGYLKRK
ncbi:MAG: creatininase family protein [Dehalococcoidales bacterium]